MGDDDCNDAHKNTGLLVCAGHAAAALKEMLGEDGEVAILIFANCHVHKVTHSGAASSLSREKLIELLDEWVTMWKETQLEEKLAAERAN